MTAPAAGRSVEHAPIQLVLFLAPDTARSQLAAQNVSAAFRAFEDDAFELETVDVFADPARALRERVLVTPTLLATACGRRIVGDLSDPALLLYFLQSIG
jgi:circadian clock protein KaiB